MGYIKMSAFKKIARLYANYRLVGHDAQGNNIQISFEDFWNQLDIEAAGGGGQPIFFDGTQLPNENNTGEPLQKGDWLFLPQGETYTNIGGGEDIEAPEGRMSFGIFDGTTWSLLDIGELPMREVIDNLQTIASDKSLSANMGVVLANRSAMIANAIPKTLEPISVNWINEKRLLRYETGVAQSSADNNARVSDYLPISTLSDNVFLSSYLRGQQASAICYYSAQDESSFISSQFFNIIGETHTTKSGYLATPGNALYFRVGTYDVDGFRLDLVEFNETPNKSDLTAIESVMPTGLAPLDIQLTVDNVVIRKSNGTDINSSVSTAKSSVMLEIDKSKTYRITTEMRSDQACGVAYYETEDIESFVGQQASYESGSAQVLQEDLVIPDNAKYWRFSSYGEFILEEVMLKKVAKQSDIDDLNRRLTDNAVSFAFEYQNSVIDKTTGLAVTSSSVWRSGYIPVSGFTSFRLQNVLEGSTAAAVYFFSKTRRILEPLVLENGTHPEIILDKTNIPSGAGYFIATASNGNVGSGLATIVGYGDAQPASGRNIEVASEYDSIIARALARQSELAVRMISDGYSPAWYGVEWDESNANPELVTAIGSDMSLHDTLPIQSKMRRCVVKDGNIQYYLNSDNSLLKEDGLSSAILDGTDGDVMVEIPDFYYKIEEEGSVKRLKISEEPIPGYNYSARRLTSAFEAVIGVDDKLYSNVVTDFIINSENIYIESENVYTQSGSSGYSLGTQLTATINGYTDNAADFKGGDGTTVFNDITDINDNNVSKNCLGRPSSNLNRKIAREAARLKAGGALMHGYDTHKALWMLSFVELKTRQYQKPVSEGGLGKGATMYPNYNAAHSFYSDMRAIIPTGVTVALGNNSGEVYYNMQHVPNSTPFGDWVDVWMPVNSYRGIENFYGHQYKSVDQINLRQYTVSGTGNDRIDNLTYFYQRNPFLTDDSFDRFTENIGSFTFNSYIKNINQLLLGKDAHIVPKNTTGSGGYTTHYCDCCELKLATALGSQVQLKEISFAGRYVSHRLCGPLFICSEGGERVDNLNYARACNVTRLDYILR